MSVAYVVLAHRGPAQLARLVSRIRHPEDRVFIHVDRRADIDPFRAALADALHDGDVRFARRRRRCHWGDFSLVAATLTAVEQALEEASFTHVTLLSGDDYPLVPVAAFRAFLAASGRRSFMFHSSGDGTEPPDRTGNERWYWNRDLRRLTYRHYRLFGRQWAVPNRYVTFVPRHRPPRDLELYQGSQWWTLSRAAAQYVVEAFVRDPRLARFFRRVQAPDEYAFQMVLGNSPLQADLVDDDLHFIEWQGWHARTLSRADLPGLRATPKPFARKLDQDRDPALLEALDELLAERADDLEGTVQGLCARYLARCDAVAAAGGVR